MDIVLNDGLGSNYQTAKEKRLYQNQNILIQPPLGFLQTLADKRKCFVRQGWILFRLLVLAKSGSKDEVENQSCVRHDGEQFREMIFPPS